MKTKTLILLQVLLWGICAFHIIVGFGLNLSTDFLSTMAQYYGAEVKDWSADFIYIVKPLGAFMVAVGILAGEAALNPLARRWTVYALVLLFFMRALQRFLFQEELTALFSIEPVRNFANMAFFLGMAVVLYLLFRAAKSSA